MVALLDIELKKIDVKIIFFNGKQLEEEIIMTLTKGFTEVGREDYVYLLNKSLCSLKQYAVV